MMEILALNRDHIDLFSQKQEMKNAETTAFFDFLTEKKSHSDLKIENGIAKISVIGILGNSWWSDSNYSRIIELTKEAEISQMVKEIEYIIDSPGGEIDGLEETARMISKVSKPTKAIVKNMACSAGYWIASQCDEIVATNEGAVIGSIGVMAVYYDYKKMMEKEGIKAIKIVSSNAPNKDTDPATEKGYKKIQERIDKQHEIFVKYVAKGRKVDIETVNENYGQGDVFVSADALENGMIDRLDLNIYGLENNNSEENEMAGNEKTYTVAEFEAAVKTAREEGIKAGTDAERERVKKHLAYAGEAKLESVKEGIESGKAFSECVETYASEKYQKIEAENRKNDNKPAEENTAGPVAKENTVPPEEGKVSVFEAHETLFNNK